MKSGRVFWAIFFIAIGSLALLYKTLSVSVHWSVVLDWWPAALILLGLAIVLKASKYRLIIVGAAGLLAALVVFSFFNRGCEVVETEWSSESLPPIRKLSEKDDSAYSKASFSFNAGAGRFRISDSTSELVTADTRSSAGGYTLISELRDSVKRVTLSMGGHSISWRGKSRNSVDISLSTRPEWVIDLDIGAAKADFDLSRYRVRRLDLDAGAASINMTLGARSPETHVRIGTGASSLKVRIPESADCEIAGDIGLSSTSFKGFQKSEDGTYFSKGSGEISGRIFLTIDAGISSIRIERYQ